MGRLLDKGVSINSTSYKRSDFNKLGGAPVPRYMFPLIPLLIKEAIFSKSMMYVH